MPPIEDLPVARYFPGKLDTQWSQVTSLFDQSLWTRAAQWQVEKLSMLSENWNSYGSPSISLQARRETLLLLPILGKLQMPEPKIFPVSGGGVQLEWKNKSCELELEVLPNGSIEFLAVDSVDGMFEDKISENNNVAEFARITAWFLNEKKTVGELANTYALSY